MALWRAAACSTRFGFAGAGLCSYTPTQLARHDSLPFVFCTHRMQVAGTARPSFPTIPSWTLDHFHSPCHSLSPLFLLRACYNRGYPLSHILYIAAYSVPLSRAAISSAARQQQQRRDICRHTVARSCAISSSPLSCLARHVIAISATSASINVARQPRVCWRLRRTARRS